MKKHKTKIVGILNITPDSYSDGGKYQSLENALSHTEEMIADGADVIDIGAESTRPGATSLSPSEEMKRLDGLIKEIYALAKRNKVRVSLDSYHYETLDQFKEYYDIINDVTGLSDINIVELCKNTGKDAIFMRSVNVPVNRSEVLPSEADVIDYVQKWLDKKMTFFDEHNIPSDRLIFDPGVAFGIGAEKDLNLIKRISELDTYGLPMMLGYSRKSFLKKFGEDDASKRDPETHVITSYLVNKEIEYLRLHNVKEAARVIKLSRELYK